MQHPTPAPPPMGDYRLFLAERFRAIKEANAKFSHRHIAMRMGARSSGWFADVLAGRQKLKPRHVARLAALFKLSDPESRMLRILVDMESADSHEDRDAAYARWIEAQRFPREQVARDRFKYFDRWYYPALRELLMLEDPAEDPAAVGARLHPPLSARQAREAAAVLKRLGLTHRDAPAPVLVKTAARTPHWRKIMEAYMELARPALSEFTREERDVSALTLSLSPASLREAGEEIAALRRRLVALSEKDAKKNRVYQCLFQVFPVSRTVEKKHA